MPTRRMKRSQAKQYLRTSRCVNPGDPGCGPKLRLRGDRWTKKDQKEQEEYAEMKRIGRMPSVVKREYMRESPKSSGKPSGYNKMEKMYEKENLASRENVAKKGTKLKKAKAAYGKLTKAKSGKKVSTTTKRKK